MASMTIRNLDDDLKARLRVRAAEHGRSMEAEAREILKSGLGSPEKKQASLSAALIEAFAPLEGEEFELSTRHAFREPPDFK